MKRIAYAILLFLPALASAQDETLQNLIDNTVEVLNTAVAPFLLAIAFFVFVWNAIRYFVIESTNEEGRKKARTIAVFGITAFVLLIIFWGIINLLVASLGLGGQSQLCPDYRMTYDASTGTCQNDPGWVPDNI